MKFNTQVIILILFLQNLFVPCFSFYMMVNINSLFKKSEDNEYNISIKITSTDCDFSVEEIQRILDGGSYYRLVHRIKLILRSMSYSIEINDDIVNEFDSNSALLNYDLYRYLHTRLTGKDNLEVLNTLKRIILKVSVGFTLLPEQLTGLQYEKLDDIQELEIPVEKKVPVLVPEKSLSEKALATARNLRKRLKIRTHQQKTKAKIIEIPQKRIHLKVMGIAKVDKVDKDNLPEINVEFTLYKSFYDEIQYNGVVTGINALLKEMTNNSLKTSFDSSLVSDSGSEDCVIGNSSILF
jgi:hypothetical protein